MKAFIKTLFGDTWNIAGVALIVMVAVALIVMVAVALTGAGHPGWAVFAMPVAGLCVVGWLARR